MSALETFVQHELANLKPEDVLGIIKPSVESMLKAVGSQDLDHDGTADGAEALAAATEVEHGLVKLAGLIQAYKAKYVK